MYNIILIFFSFSVIFYYFFFFFFLHWIAQEPKSETWKYNFRELVEYKQNVLGWTYSELVVIEEDKLKDSVSMRHEPSHHSRTRVSERCEAGFFRGRLHCQFWEEVQHTEVKERTDMAMNRYFWHAWIWVGEWV